MSDSYTPVQYEFREVIQELIDQQRSGKVFYFAAEAMVDSAEGKLIRLDEISGK